MKKGRFDWAGGPDGEGGRDRELNRQVLPYNPWSKGRSWPEFYHTFLNDHATLNPNIVPSQKSIYGRVDK